MQFLGQDVDSASAPQFLPAEPQTLLATTSSLARVRPEKPTFAGHRIGVLPTRGGSLNLKREPFDIAE